MERLRDGDPSVQKDWLPPDEVLRRIHDDGDEPWLSYVVTSTFASLTSVWSVWESAVPSMRSILGVSEHPYALITATDASGAALASGGSASRPGTITLKLSLSGKSTNFDASDVLHTNCARPRFLGMKNTYYLQCEHAAGAELSVSVPAGAFTVTDRARASEASEAFVLSMV